MAPKGRLQMRTVSFIFAFAMLFLGPSMAGTSDSGLPGVGTFAYGGSVGAQGQPNVLMAAIH